MRNKDWSNLEIGKMRNGFQSKVIISSCAIISVIFSPHNVSKQTASENIYFT